MHRADRGRAWRLIARQVRWARGMLALFAAFCLSMGAAYLGVSHYLHMDRQATPPDAYLIRQGERLRELQADVTDAAQRLHDRLPAGQSSVTPADVRWASADYLPRLNYLRLRLEDRHAWAGLPHAPHEAATHAVDALRAAAREPASVERRARAFELVRAAAQAVEQWLREAGVNNYVRTPATLPRL